jgi:hypothetical protein
VRKIILTLITSAALLSAGSAVVAQEDRCQDLVDFEFENPGDVNQVINDMIGTPGQQEFEAANVFAHERNDVRKEICPPPGHQ